MVRPLHELSRRINDAFWDIIYVVNVTTYTFQDYCGGQVMSKQREEMRGPHQGLPVLTAGESLASARAAMILVHGRGATATDILMLAEELAQPGFAYLAPEAANNSWYPNSFLAPLASNEPGLSSGLALIASLLEQVNKAGNEEQRRVIAG